MTPAEIVGAMVRDLRAEAATRGALMLAQGLALTAMRYSGGNARVRRRRTRRMRGRPALYFAAAGAFADVAVTR